MGQVASKAPSARRSRAETLIQSTVPSRSVTEELSLTMEALEGLWRARRELGWGLRVYDYSANAWVEGDEAFSRPGTYELAILKGPSGGPVRVRLLPPGSHDLQVDPGSAGDVAVWRLLGVSLSARHLELISLMLEGRSGPVSVAEVADLLRAEGGGLALEAHDAMAPLLRGGGGP